MVLYVVRENEELAKISVVANFATTAAEGKIYQVEYYNLDVILSVKTMIDTLRSIKYHQNLRPAMNPKPALFLFVFFTCSYLTSAQPIAPIQGKRWYPPSEHIAYIQFVETTYDIYFSVGGHYCTGNYTITGNQVTLIYPELNQPLFDRSRNLLSWLFQGSTQTTFTHDPAYIDFDCLTCLRNSDRLLKSGTPSPCGEAYKLQGVDVIKYDNRQSRVLILDNLRMRDFPSTNANVLSLEIYDLRTHDPITTSVVNKNSTYRFDAKTVKTDTIDGITAPWYRIAVILDETYHRNVWVFGGYVRELSLDEINNQK
jgi:hypothetical protein